MGMTDLSNVINGLKCLRKPQEQDCDSCIYGNKRGCYGPILDDAIAVVESYKPKPPVWKERIVPVFEEYEDGTGAIKSQNWSDWFCPTCGGLVGERYWIPGREPHDQHECKFCPKCGQAIDWDSAEK